MRSWCCSFLVSFLPLAAFAITPEDVVKSSLEHFPKVIEAIQSVEMNEGQARESLGAFDAKIKSEVDARTKGYYSGDAYKAQIEKPFTFLNTKVYAGKRQSYGSFPSYEGKFETLSGGENYAGVSLSLLRDSLIDKNRYTWRIRQQDTLQAKIRLEQVKINVQTMALQAYWTWVIKGHELKVFKNILSLALDRARNLKKRIRAGDLARIYEAENNQYIQKRRVSVLKSEYEFKKASYYLSLFYRDVNGTPQSLTGAEIPDISNEVLTSIPDSLPVYQQAKAKSLELQELRSQEKQAELDVRLGTNNILPKVDVNFEWNQDQIVGPPNINSDENRIMLNIDIPLQFRKGLGKRRAGKAKQAQIEAKQKLTYEKLKVNTENLVLQLNAYAEIYKISTDQVKLADKLAAAERRKFSQGASDLILVNIREETLAEAQVKNLASLLEYHFVDSEVKNLQVQFITPQ